MQRTGIIQIPIYRKTLQLVFGDSEYLRKVLKEEYDLKEHLIEDFVEISLRSTGMLYIIEENPREYYLWLPKVPESTTEYGALVHELEHFAYYLMQDVGVTHTEASDEAYAYLMEYMFNKIGNWIDTDDEEETNTIYQE